MQYIAGVLQECSMFMGMKYSSGLQNQAWLLYYIQKSIWRNLLVCLTLSLSGYSHPPLLVPTLPKCSQRLWTCLQLFICWQCSLMLKNISAIDITAVNHTNTQNKAFNQHKLMLCLMLVLLVYGNFQNSRSERITRSTSLLLSNFIPPGLPSAFQQDTHSWSASSHKNKGLPMSDQMSF